ncbi:Ctr copper transporter family protein [Talaromyces proteolyticus]|uniref:Copper transport protein n=1 Tax=Talaromyces proteolyticus TaxID=1131652 RepID=A0AAD4PW24_9EURO|nr:Ctr copper transporter family protein [Talaromyces proteolyticus]KAH8694117.1 Ctr copper transporter family protein [Talaromyces proteolyticus]
MLFTWSTKNLCIVFPEWRITGTGSLIASLLVIILLTAAYEGIRSFTRTYEAKHAQRLRAYTTPSLTDNENIQESTVDVGTGHSRGIANITSSLLVGRDSKQALEQRGRIVMALLYAVQVFYSFFIMLLFMTYNGWIMIAVAAGAFVGYLVFGGGAPATKSAACH